MAVYRFGPFELDATAAELSRDGERVRLRPQPCSALAYLVARHGLFVSRHQLYEALWPEGIFVQFDKGLNSCIKQIRAALGDSRTSPRYIETLTRRGYRFIAPVHVVAIFGRESRQQALRRASC
jgi:DNA-binding winged helix-turn-helix (wHTH) protein